MATRRIEEVVERISNLRDAPSAEAIPALAKALADRVNVVVAKAAEIAGERQLRELVSGLLTAFDRLFERAAERDPQCWGKVALARALRDLEYRQAAPFLRGARHVQLEAVWGGREDTAQTLRGTCLLALMACTDITRAELFRCLVDGLTEKESVVRTEAVRGLAELDGDEAALLLRMKARVGDEEPRILGQVFDALWKVEGERAIAFVAPFLEAPADAVREEAALALGASRFAAAVGILRDALDRGRHPQFREVLLRALSLTRQPAALDFLLGLVKTGRMADAEAALDALALHRENQEIRRLAQEAAKGREELRQKFERSFPNEPLVPADR